MGNTTTDRLETPPWLFDQLNTVFNFQLDACASDENRLCDEYYTEEDDCLKQNWGFGPVWLNPPYSKPALFLSKAIDEAAKGVTTVALLKGDPSTMWWNLYVKGHTTLVWIPKRIRFYMHGRPTKYAASFPSVLAIYWGISWSF